jgi:hypothetical protein
MVVWIAKDANAEARSREARSGEVRRLHDAHDDPPD